jgi:serine/threonine protein phosphatase PrpC
MRMMSGSLQAGGHAAQGASHGRAGKPCQDRVLVRHRGGDAGGAQELVAVAVADGHGSSRHAEDGARIAVEVATEQLVHFYETLGREQRAHLGLILERARMLLRRNIVREWVRQVGLQAGKEVCPELLREYGATLLFVLVTREFVLLGHLGDGDILWVDAAGEVRRPIPRDEAAFADETPSLCQPEADLYLHMTIRPRPAGEVLLLLCSDGYANSYADDATFERIGADYLALVRSRGFAAVLELLPQFLSQVSERGSGDDVTLGLVYSLPSGASEPPDETTETPVVGVATDDVESQGS